MSTLEKQAALLQITEVIASQPEFPTQNIASISVEEGVICLVTVGLEREKSAIFSGIKTLLNLRRSQKIRHAGHMSQPYHLLGCESEKGEKIDLRPGSGIIRAYDGRPRGPAGTLTCFLKSKDKADDITYLLGASHVLTNYWRLGSETKDPRGSLYRNFKGYASKEDRRYVGTLVRYSLPPPLVNPMGISPVTHQPNDVVPVSGEKVDAAIVRMRGDFGWKQKTTCYGQFGDDFASELKPDMWVTKCGAEEPYMSSAQVKGGLATVYVFGPGQAKPYCFKDQIELSTEAPELAGRAFALPGDSGTMVVVADTTHTPVGMLIAGSILSGRYVMTPFSALRDFWSEGRFVLA